METDIELTLFNGSSQLLERINYEGEQEGFELNLSTYPKGIYYLKIKSGDFYAWERVILL